MSQSSTNPTFKGSSLVKGVTPTMPITTLQDLMNSEDFVVTPTAELPDHLKSKGNVVANNPQNVKELPKHNHTCSCGHCDHDHEHEHNHKKEEARKAQAEFHFNSDLLLPKQLKSGKTRQVFVYNQNFVAKIAATQNRLTKTQIKPLVEKNEQEFELYKKAIEKYNFLPTTLSVVELDHPVNGQPTNALIQEQLKPLSKQTNVKALNEYLAQPSMPYHQPLTPNEMMDFSEEFSIPLNHILDIRNWGITPYGELKLMNFIPTSQIV